MRVLKTGSHLPQADGQFEQAPADSDPPSAVSLDLKRGDAIIFDRRILHAGEHSVITMSVIFQ